jgi:Mg2+ and Co2+ transporter CorA
MGEFVYNYYQLRNTDAVNRLAVLSLIFGGGAVLTGFFGMNFGREFGQIIFEGQGTTPAIHYFLVALVVVVVFGSLGLGVFLVFWNWRDYLEILHPVKSRRRARLRRDV